MFHITLLKSLQHHVVKLIHNLLVCTHCRTSHTADVSLHLSLQSCFQAVTVMLTKLEQRGLVTNNQLIVNDF